MSVDANLSGRIVTTSRRQRTAALQSRSSHDYRLLHPYLVRHLASDALRLWRAAVRSFSLWKERKQRQKSFSFSSPADSESSNAFRPFLGRAGLENEMIIGASL